MDIRDQVADVIEDAVAKVFRRDKAEIAANHGLRLKEDLNANSKHYFPILAALSDKFNLEIDYHEFQFYATTVETAIDYAVDQYHEQIG